MKKKTILLIFIGVLVVLITLLVAEYYTLSKGEVKSIKVRKTKTK